MGDNKRCEFCDLDFKCVPALVSHLRWTHDIKSSFSCSMCNLTFISKKELIAHNKLHKKPSPVLTCPLCQEKYEKNPLLDHFSKVHGQNIREEKLHFKSVEHFFEWKKKMEADTTSYFVMRATAVKTKSGITKTYVCHRDGTYVPRGRNKKKMKSIGSNKINGHCPAKITARFIGGTVVINFVKTHVGHSMDLERINIPKEEKERIAQQIASNVPFDDILDEIKDSVMGKNMKRQHLITRKDLHNIVQKYKLNSDAVKEENSNFNLDCWIQQMKDDTSLVRFYKPCGVSLLDHPTLQNDDFVLVFANDLQLKMLVNNGQEFICIETTFGHNCNDYKLCTIMVLDHQQDSFPCAFMVCSKVDFETMSLFFGCVKRAIGCDLCPRYFISDPEDYIYNAWTSVMLNCNTFVLYSTWSIESNWKSNLTMIPNADLQSQIFKLLKSLMKETEVNLFTDKCNEMLRELKSSSETVGFSNYISKFLNNPFPWAYCYRKTDMINASLESFNQLAKLFSMKCKKGRRLDKNINVLIRSVKERFFENLKLYFNERIFNESDIHDQHKAASSLSNLDIYIINEKWYIPSTDTESYEVVSDKVDCDCNWRCEACSACFHQYKCSCLDYVVQWKMCKHIHLIAMVAKQSVQPECDSDWLSSEPVVNYGDSSVLLGNITEEINTTVLNEIKSEELNSVNVDLKTFDEPIEIDVQEFPEPIEISIVSYEESVGNTQEFKSGECLEEVKKVIQDQFFETLEVIETVEEAGVLQNAIAPVKSIVLNLKKR